MTRKDAIWKATRASAGIHGAPLVDTLTALGVLNVSGPAAFAPSEAPQRAAIDRISKMLRDRSVGPLPASMGMVVDIYRAMEDAGLELVEKKK